mmetsp:Transcript_19840/g.17536  ORF Transcript_19840/g.17536 Transcript_19840/m.17536 type:complete len:107 (+) Transcript_19840:567-887(+)
MSKEGLQFFKTDGKELLKLVYDVRKWIRKLVYVRNKIFQSLKVLDLFRSYKNGVRTLYPLTKEDHVNIADRIIFFKSNGYFNPFRLWKINKKEECGKYGSDIELSD